MPTPIQKLLTTLTIIMLLAVTLLPGLFLFGPQVAAAAPIEDLTTLAALYPADTPFFFTLRTDDDYISTIDAILRDFGDRLPPEAQIPTLTTLLNQSVIEGRLGLSFRDVFRPWLGNLAAFGLLDISTLFDDSAFNDAPGMLFTVKISDRAAAEGFMNQLVAEAIDNGDIIVRAIGNYTVYQGTSESEQDLGFAIGDDVLALAFFSLGDFLSGVPDNALLDNPDFQHVMDLMPADDYNMLAYVDSGALLELQLAALEASGQDLPPGYLELVRASAGTTGAIGATILPGRTLTLDIAAQVDTDMMAAAGFPMVEQVPVDADFLRFVPAGAQAVIHARDLQMTFDNMLETLRNTVLVQGSSPEDIDDALGMLEFSVRGALGLNLREDILAWMTGEYAMYFSLDTSAAGDLITDLQADLNTAPVLETFPLSLGLVVEAVDPEAAQTFAAALGDNLPDALAASGMAYERSIETIGGTPVTVFSFPVEDEDSTLDVAPFELIVGANDDVFVLGTRDAAEAALIPGDGLPGSEAYQMTTGIMLDDPVSVLYLSPEGGMIPMATVGTLLLLGPTINNIFENIVSQLGDPPPTPAPTPAPEEIARRNRADLLDALLILDEALGYFSFFQEASVSSSTTADGTSVVRLTLSLAE